MSVFQSATSPPVASGTVSPSRSQDTNATFAAPASSTTDVVLAAVNRYTARATEDRIQRRRRRPVRSFPTVCPECSAQVSAGAASSRAYSKAAGQPLFRPPIPPDPVPIDKNASQWACRYIPAGGAVVSDGVCGARLELKKLDPHFSPSKHRTKPRGTKREVCATRGDAWQRVSVRCVKHRRRPCFKAHVKIWKETMSMRNIGTSMYIFRLVACRAGFMCASRAKMKWYADCRIEQLNAYVQSVAEEKKACLYKESAKRADIVLKKTLTTMDKNAKDAR